MSELRRILPVAAAAALALTACANDGNSNSGGSGGGSSDPITIMAFGGLSKPPFAVPQIEVGAQAAVNRINSEGGVGGRQLRLITCDDLGNPNGAAACGRQAVQENVAGVVGAFTFFGDSIVPLLDKGNIPYILPVARSNEETTNRVSFPVFTGTGAAAGSFGALAEKGCKKVAVLVNDAGGSHALIDQYMTPVAAKTEAEVMPVYMPPTASDIAPFVAQASAAGADCFEFGVSAQQTSAGLVALAQSGVAALSSSNALALPEVVLGQIAREGEGFLSVSNFFYPSTGEPAAVRLAADMAAVDPESPVDDVSINAYAGVLAFAESAKGLDKVDGAAVLAALEARDTLDVGLFPPVDMSRAGFVKTIPRVAASELIVYVARDGKYVSSGQPNVDLSTLLTGL